MLLPVRLYGKMDSGSGISSRERRASWVFAGGWWLSDVENAGWASSDRDEYEVWHDAWKKEKNEAASGVQFHALCC